MIKTGFNIHFKLNDVIYINDIKLKILNIIGHNLTIETQEKNIVVHEGSQIFICKGTEISWRKKPEGRRGTLRFFADDDVFVFREKEYFKRKTRLPN